MRAVAHFRAGLYHLSHNRDRECVLRGVQDRARQAEFLEQGFPGNLELFQERWQGKQGGDAYDTPVGQDWMGFPCIGHFEFLWLN